MGLRALSALMDAGFQISAIWTGDSRFPGLPSSPFISPFSRPFKKRLAREVRRCGASPRLIGRPRAAALEAALAQAPDFDILVCAGSDIILPGPFLKRMARRAVNFHPALLPHYKGPFPLQALLMDGAADRYGGMTLHVLEAGIDAGPIIAQRGVALSDHETPDDWMEAVLEAMDQLIAGELIDYVEGRVKPVPQPAGAGSYISAREVRLHAGPGQTVDQIKAYLAVTPTLHSWARAIIPIKGRNRKFVVTGSPHIVGRPTGEPARLAMFHVEFDALEARIRLRRVLNVERAMIKIARQARRAGWKLQRRDG
jgi:methionyl-tRNA formyltransferase